MKNKKPKKPASQPTPDLTLMEVMRRFATEESARAYMEAIRWPKGPVCPHCGNSKKDSIGQIAANKETKVRPGLYQCRGEKCGQQFTVTVGTVCEDSHIPLNKWLIAFYMMCASKTNISALQLKRQLELGSYRTAWFMCKRIQFALQDTVPPDDKLKGTVEADETYIGGKVRGKGRRYIGNKATVVSLVERGGRVRSQRVAKATSAELDRLLRTHVSKKARLNTDEFPLYRKIGKNFKSHDTVNHGDEEYVRYDKATGRVATTNTVEGFFGNSKRSLDGTHHHVSAKHLDLYLAELDYKYNTRKDTDGSRTVGAIQKIAGKRLMLRRSTGTV